MSSEAPFPSYYNEPYIDPNSFDWTGCAFDPANEPALRPNAVDAALYDPKVDPRLQQQLGELVGRAEAAWSSHTTQEEDHHTGVQSNNSKPFCLNPDAEVFIPQSLSRPILPFLTTDAGSVHACAYQLEPSPKTPKIRVLAPTDAIPSPSVKSRQRIHSRARERRRSSPIRRESHSIATPQRRRRQAPDNGLLRPDLVQAWVAGQYDPGYGLPLPSHLSMEGVPGQPTLPAHAHPNNNKRGPFYCDFLTCKQRRKAWLTKSEYKKHQRTHLSKDQWPHACSECGIPFMYPKDVARHAKAKHKGGAASSCEICKKVLSRDDNLQRHLKDVHGVTTTTNPSTEPSVVSPGSTASFPTYSESHNSDASTAPTSPWLEEPQTACRSLNQRLLLPASPRDPFIRPLGEASTSVPVISWCTNQALEDRNTLGRR